MKQTIYIVMTTKMGPFVSIIHHIIFEKYFFCPSKYHEMKILLPVTSARKWAKSAMLQVNIAITVETTDGKYWICHRLSIRWEVYFWLKKFLHMVRTGLCSPTTSQSPCPFNYFLFESVNVSE